jgi:hypothetical protein
MHRPLVTAALTMLATVSFASTCPQGDEMLKNNTSLASLCPNGFTSQSGGDMATAMDRQKNNVSMVYASAQNMGVPPELALAVSYHEAVGFNSCAGSDTGVRGPMQLTKRTGRSYGYDRDINEQNVNGGMKVLKTAYDRCGMDYACLSANYNGSPRPGEQAGWARGVGAAHQKLLNTPSLMAKACSGAQPAACVSPGDFPNPGTTPSLVAGTLGSSAGNAGLAGIVPQPASTDIIVGSRMASVRTNNDFPGG